MSGPPDHLGRFSVDDRVRVLRQREDGNPRTPVYVRGRVGRVTHAYGVLDNPLDHRDPYPPLYTVVFDLAQVFERPSRDQVAVDLHEDWLEPASGG